MLKIIPLVVLAAICFADTDELDVRLRPMVVGCGNAQLPALPVSRAPFERSAEVSRRPVTLATWPFHPQGGWTLLGEERLTTWAEFRSGDKSVVANGYEGRIHTVGRTGFGKLVFYRGGSESATLAERDKSDIYARELLSWLEIRALDGSKQYSRYMECYSNATIRVDEKAARVDWTRPCNGAAARYSLVPAGDGKLALEWETPSVPVEFRLYLCGSSTNGQHGVENGTRIYVNRDRETDRVEIAFPDGTARAEGTSTYVWRTDAASGRVMIDLCGSTIPNSSTPNSPTPTSGIIDFWAEDALDVPPDPTGNLLANGSFEQGLTGWNYWWNGEPWSVVAATGEPLESITGEAKVGDRALRMRSSKPRGTYEAIQSAPMSIMPGVEHALSAWVKRASGEQGEAKIVFTVDPVARRFNLVTKPDGSEAKLIVPLADDEWHFVEMPFVSECGDCKIVMSGSGAAVVVDGVRVERGDLSHAETQSRREGGSGAPRMPQYVEGRLETSNPDNLLTFGAPINARLALSGSDGAKGAVRVTVRNFYNETVFKKAFKFKLPKDKVLPLDFDSAKLGTGVFVLGTEFLLNVASATGSFGVSEKCDFEVSELSKTPKLHEAKAIATRYRGPYQRFAILKPLGGKHRTADFYLQLGWYEKSSNGEKLADYARDLGIMATNWRTNGRFADTNAPETQLRKKCGFANRLHVVSSELAAMYPDLCKPGMPCHPKSLTNAVPEKVAFIEKAAYEVGLKAAPDDNWWAFYNEEDAELATIRYAKTHEERLKACEDWFQYQYACWKGLKRAFDERGIALMYAPTHGCCYYNPDWHGRDTMDCYMEVAGSHGFRYDFIAVHAYGAIDGSFLGKFDRDENASILLARMAEYGYPETTPVMFSEGFNILPFYMPRWGAVAFADAYSNGGPASLDLGWREFLQAGAMARLYIMDLKYWPRLKNSHTWQHRLVADARMSPFMWNMVPNTLGHLLPSPKFVGDVKRDGWRAYVFRQGDYGVAAVWTNERQAELGRNKGMTLKLPLPDDARFVDLMGNPRSPAFAKASAGKPFPDPRSPILLPLTPAPLFIVSRDAEGLLKAFGGVN